MSLLRIPFSISILWAVYTTTTAPQPTPEARECIEPRGLEVVAMPFFLKLWSLCLSLAEILTIFASVYPSSNISQVVIAMLVHSDSSTPLEIHLTWTFMFSWICTMSGVYIRRSCYQTLGPYSVVRHPSYIGGALALLGALACYTSPGSWFIECSGLFPSLWKGSVVFSFWFIAGSIAWLVILPRLKKEDAMLKGQFGSQWDAWVADVPYKLIPGVY